MSSLRTGGGEVPAEAILCLVLIHCVKPTYETPKKAHITSTQITPLRCHKEGGGDFYTERKPNCKKDPTAMTCSTDSAGFNLGHVTTGLSKKLVVCSN